MRINNELLIKAAAQFEVFLDRQALERFEILAHLLTERNKQINLTAITEPDEIVIKHFADSLSLFMLVSRTKSLTVIDVGTGAGFPGIPMLVVNPELKLTFLDSTKKKLLFVEEAVNALGLKASFVHSRAEDAGRETGMRERFDCAVSRAVAALPVLAEYCLPFVKVGGRFIAMKGAVSEGDSELSSNAAEILGGNGGRLHSFELLDKSQRTLIEIKKTSQTPTKYPRTSIQISKTPL